MTGWNWAGIEEHFIHAPEQYEAIWFHEDSLDELLGGSGLRTRRSGRPGQRCYAVRLSQGDTKDRIPFFVTPPRGTATAKILLLVPTVSYLAYANTQVMQNAPSAQAIMGHVAVLEETDLELNERSGMYGLSTYDYHIDGRGCQYTSWLRPIMNMRPHTVTSSARSGSSRQIYNWSTG